MSDSVSKKVLAVRTYANDLAETRAVRDHTDTTAVMTKSTVTTLPTAVTTIAHTTPTAVSGVPQKLVFTEPKSKKGITSRPSTVTDTNTITAPPKNTIPPFHTFQKPAVTIPAAPAGVTKISVPTSVISTQPKASILTNPSHGVSVGDEADAATEATVITDTKRSKFSITAAVTKSMSGWFQNKKDTITGKNKPKYTVPQADRRKGVIQKATSMTGRTSTADHAEVLKRLRANKQTAGIVPVTTPKIVASEPTWDSAALVPATAPTPKTPTTLPVQTITSEPIVVHTPKPVVASVPPLPKIVPTIPQGGRPAKPVVSVPVISPTPASVPEIQRPAITPITPELPRVTPAAIAKIIPTRPVIPRVAPPHATAPTVTTIVRPLITPTVPTTPRSAAMSIAPSVVETVPEIILAASPVPPAAATKKTNAPKNIQPKISLRFRLQNIFTHTDRIVISGGIVATAIIIAGLGYRYYLQRDSDTPLATQTETAVPVFNQMTFDTKPVTASSKEVIVAALQSAAASPDSSSEISFIDPVSSTTLGVDTFFSLFGVTTLTAFKSTITKVALGAYRGEPWLLLRVTDTPTAQGGMFDWESRMSTDLSPVYGTVVTAKKNTITDFIDTAISGIDVRVLQDEQNKERITYGFVAPNYILITTTTSTWLNLHEHWRTE
jgi:hypothetical protein